MKKKRCPKCGKTKNIIAFYKSKRTKDGLYGWCKGCYVIHNRKNYEKNKEKGYVRYLKNTYGLTIEQYNKRLKQQNYKCAICSKTKEENKRRLNVDHSHKTNFIRGLLCNYCNGRLVGFLCDTKDCATNLIKYLQNAIDNDKDWI